MSKMIDRVAKAMEAAHDATGMDYRDVSLPHLARVAIEAMREPTEAMVSVGESVRVYDGLDEMDSYGHPMNVWQAMLDESLK